MSRHVLRRVLVAGRGTQARLATAFCLHGVVSAGCAASDVRSCDTSADCGDNAVCVDARCVVTFPIQPDGDARRDVNVSDAGDDRPSQGPPDASDAAPVGDGARDATDATDSGDAGDPPTCVDLDHDSYGRGPGCLGADCDDGDGTIHPAALERCDGVDEDCDGETDEDVLQSCQSDLGCEGEQRCAGGEWDACDAPLPAPETCNGRDDDCDGVIDDGVFRPSTAEAGIVAAGAVVCETSGALTAGDSSVAGLAYRGPTDADGGDGVPTVDGVRVGACVEADFGVALSIASLRIRASAANSACGVSCAGLCGTNRRLEVFSGIRGGTLPSNWHHVGSITSLTDALGSYDIAVSGPGLIRFLLLCRTATDPSRGHVAVDGVEARLCP